MRAWIVLLGLLSTAACAAEAPLSFNGIRLDAGEAEILQRFPGAQCAAEGAGERGCTVSAANIANPQAQAAMTVGGVPVSLITFTLHDGRISWIFMWPPAAQFDRIATAFEASYGKPGGDQVRPVTSATGARLENRKIIWDQPGGRVAIEKFSGSDNNNSRVGYYSPAGIKRVEQMAERGEIPGAGNR